MILHLSMLFIKIFLSYSSPQSVKQNMSFMIWNDIVFDKKMFERHHPNRD